MDGKLWFGTPWSGAARWFWRRFAVCGHTAAAGGHYAPANPGGAASLSLAILIRLQAAATY